MHVTNFATSVSFFLILTIASASRSFGQADSSRQVTPQKRDVAIPSSAPDTKYPFKPARIYASDFYGEASPLNKTRAAGARIVNTQNKSGTVRAFNTAATILLIIAGEKTHHQYNYYSVH